MRRETGAKLHIVVPPNEDGPGDRTCAITGPPDCVAEAKRRIVEMIDSCVVSYFIILHFEKYRNIFVL